MAHVILGMLLISQQSLYDLIKTFGQTVSLFYSASAGSIKRALDGLLSRGLIEVASVDPGARGRKVYRVTETGREEFRTWMTGELAGTDTEVAALSRLYFLGLLAPRERGPVLERIIGSYETDLSRLTALDEQLQARNVPEGHRDVFEYQRATLDYGLAVQRFAVEWFRAQADRHR